MRLLKRRIAADITHLTGSHDDPAIFGAPAGDPGLVGPGSVSWEIHSDPAAVAVAGGAAIIMEILHPSVMAGVQDQSSYATQPLRRARNTSGYVITTTFGNTDAATKLIGRVRRMHERVNGTRPDGIEYHALDPELIGWVHTCIPWAVMRAFEHCNRPLSEAERDRYLAEQAVIGRMGGAGEIPTTAAGLDSYLDEMRPKLAINAQTREFFAFLLSNPLGPKLPRALADASNRFQIHASMSVMPRWAQELTGFAHSPIAQRVMYEPYLALASRTIRWALGVPPYVALAHARTADVTARAAGEGLEDSSLSIAGRR
jgi:uncharacterized protein (DUF2236 family)